MISRQLGLEASVLYLSSLVSNRFIAAKSIIPIAYAHMVLTE